MLEYGASQVLVDAIKSGDLLTAQQLLRDPAITKFHDDWPRSLLQIACEHNQPLIVAELLKRPTISRELGTYYCRTNSLQLAVEQGYFAVIQQLINSGHFSFNTQANEHAGSYYEKSRIYISHLVFRGKAKPDLVKWILDTYVPIFKLDAGLEQNAHMLFLKVTQSSKLRRVFNIEIKNSEGGTLFEEACKSGHLDIIELLLPHWKSDTEVLYKGLQIACYEENIDLAEWLLKQPGIVVTDDLLKVAIETGNLRVADWLLQLKDKQGQLVFTADRVKPILNSGILHECCQDNKKFHTLQWLLRQPHIDIYQLNNAGFPPVVYIVDRIENNDKMVIAFLEQVCSYAKPIDLFKDVHLEYYTILLKYVLSHQDRFSKKLFIPVIDLIISSPKFLQANLLNIMQRLDDQGKYNLTFVCVKYLLGLADKNAELNLDAYPSFRNFINGNVEVINAQQKSQSALVFATIVSLCDGLWSRKSPEDVLVHQQSILRFLRIAQQLPLELQVVLALRLFGQDGIKIPNLAVEAALRVTLPPAPLARPSAAPVL